MVNDHTWPQDRGQGISESDYNDAASVAQALFDPTLQDIVIAGLELQNVGNGTFDVTSGVAKLYVPSMETKDHGTGSEFRDECLITQQVEKRTGLPYDENGTTHVFLSVDLSSNNSVSIETSSIDAEPPSPSMKLGTVDGFTETPSWANRKLKGDYEEITANTASVLTAPDESQDVARLAELLDAQDTDDNTVASSIAALVAGSGLSWSVSEDGDTVTLDVADGVGQGGDAEFEDLTANTASVLTTPAESQDVARLAELLDAQDTDGNTVASSIAALAAGTGLSWGASEDGGTVTLDVADDVVSGGEAAIAIRESESATTFSENYLSIQHGATTVENGSIQLGRTTGSIGSQWSADTDDYPGDSTVGATFIPQMDTTDLEVTLMDSGYPDFQSVTITEGRSTDNTEVASYGAASPGSTISIPVELNRNQRYSIWFHSDATRNRYISGTGAPFSNAYAEEVAGVSVFSTELQNYVWVVESFTFINEDISNSTALISWDSLPSPYRAWETATFETTRNGGSVSVDVVDQNENTLVEDIPKTGVDLSALDDSENIGFRVELTRAADGEPSPSLDRLHRQYIL